MIAVSRNGTAQLLPGEGNGPLELGDRRHALLTSCEVSHSENPDGQTCSVLRVVGDVDWNTSGELSAEVNKLLTVDYPARLILDLKGVTHIDSSGVGALLEGLHDANKKHVRFTLSGLNRSLLRLMERTQLNVLFDIRSTVDEALQT
jgi:anti-sigma B factor antagonist